MPKTPKNKSITEDARTILAIIESGVGVVSWTKSIRSLSSERTYNLTCYLMANYGAAFSGMNEKLWSNEAKTILKILKK